MVGHGEAKTESLPFSSPLSRALAWVPTPL